MFAAGFVRYVARDVQLLAHLPRDAEGKPDVRRITRGGPAFSMLAFLIGMLGLWLQLTFNFGVPFPFNIILLPVRILEWWLKYYVASEIFFEDSMDSDAAAQQGLQQLRQMAHRQGL